MFKRYYIYMKYNGAIWLPLHWNLLKIKGLFACHSVGFALERSIKTELRAPQYRAQYHKQIRASKLGCLKSLKCYEYDLKCILNTQNLILELACHEWNVNNSHGLGEILSLEMRSKLIWHTKSESD